MCDLYDLLKVPSTSCSKQQNDALYIYYFIKLIKHKTQNIY